MTSFSVKSWFSLVLVTFLVGCADATKGAFVTSISPEKAAQFASEALKAVGFQVKSEHASGGIVSGEKYALSRWSGPALTEMKVTVKPLDQGARVEVEVIPPSAAYGSAQIPLDDYAYTLRLLVPDLTAVNSKKDG
jgi:hypothetical protein